MIITPKVSSVLYIGYQRFKSTTMKEYVKKLLDGFAPGDIRTVIAQWRLMMTNKTSHVANELLRDAVYHAEEMLKTTDL